MIRLTTDRGSGTPGEPARTGGGFKPEYEAGYHLRDITHGQAVGVFPSESAALNSLRGKSDGRFSVNDHRGHWCEVEVRGGARFVRYSLMANGAPAEFVGIDWEP